MTPESQRGPSVLIVDPDAAIRVLVEAVLKHAGFRSKSAGDLATAAALLDRSRFAVILRDLDLAPAESRRSLQQLAATAPELLQRTVVMTTTSARAATAVGAGTVFAIVGKPFDIENLVSAVSACARASCEADRREASSAPDSKPSVQLESVQRFVSSVPSLQRLLSAPVRGEREAALRAEMRRTLGVLSATLTEAAHEEASRTHAAVFRAASTVATRLATVSLAYRAPLETTP